MSENAEERKEREFMVACFSLLMWFCGLVLVSIYFGKGWLGVALIASVVLDNFTINVRRRE